MQRRYTLLVIALAIACGGARSTTPQRLAVARVTAACVAVRVDTIPWAEANMHPTVQWFRKRLLTDTTARGIYVSLLRYPAGVINPNHTHPHPHGFYILQGQLVTSCGTFGPETLVWFPANEVIYHGAGPGQDMIALFISGAPFKIEYVAK